MGFLVTIFSGILAGWIAGKLMDSKHGVVMNCVIGLIGGVVGSVVLGLIGLGATGFIGGIVVSVIGSCLLIWVARKI